MPLTFDMPLEKLHTYEGRTPRPADFDEFWSRSIAELDGIAPDVHTEPADFSCSFAACEDLYFTSTDNVRVHGKLLRPAKPNGAAVLSFHGYTGNAGEWVALLPYAAAGITVAAMDCRGQGGLTDDPGQRKGTSLHGHIIRGLESALQGEPERFIYRNIFLDTVQFSRVIKALPDVDASRVGATGWSQGGGLTLACAALDPEIYRIAPVYPYLCDYKRVWEMDLAVHAYNGLREFFRHHDPLHERETEIFEALGYIDVQHLTDRIRAQTLLGIGLTDQTCPPSTQFAAYNRISAPKELAVYPDFGHEVLPGHRDRIFGFFTSL